MAAREINHSWEIPKKSLAIRLLDRLPELRRPSFEIRPKFNPRKKPETLGEDLRQLVAAYHDWILRIGVYQPKRPRL